MKPLQIISPFPQFFDLDGTALDNGYVYIGEVNEDPETNPITVYSDYDLTVTVAQPVRTLNGYPTSDGSTPINIYYGDEYSITVRDKNAQLIYTNPAGYGYISELNPATIFSDRLEFDTIALLKADGVPTVIKSARVLGGAQKGLYIWSNTIGTGVKPDGYSGAGSWILDKEMYTPEDFGFDFTGSSSERTQSYDDCAQFCHANRRIMMHSANSTYVVGDLTPLDNSDSGLEIKGHGSRSSIINYTGTNDLWQLGELAKTSTNSEQSWRNFSAKDVAMISDTGKSAISLVWRYAAGKVIDCHFEGWSEYAIQPEDDSGSSKNKEWTWHIIGNTFAFCKGGAWQNSHAWIFARNRCYAMSEAGFKKTNGAATDVYANDMGPCSVAGYYYKFGYVSHRGGYNENGYGNTYTGGAFSLQHANIDSYGEQSMAMTPAPSVFVDASDSNILHLEVDVSHISHQLEPSAIKIDVTTNKLVESRLSLGVCSNTAVTKGSLVDFTGSVDNVVRSEISAYRSSGSYTNIIDIGGEESVCEVFDDIDIGIGFERAERFIGYRETFPYTLLDATFDIEFQLLNGIVTCLIPKFTVNFASDSSLSFTLPANMSPDQENVISFIATGTIRGTAGRTPLHARVNSDGTVNIHANEVSSTDFLENDVLTVFEQVWTWRLDA